jgi:transcription termination/antitermination protein NusG
MNIDENNPGVQDEEAHVAQEVEGTADAPVDSEEKAASEVMPAEEKIEEPIKATANPNLKWYVVHTYSMYEEKAKQALQERIRQFKMQERFGQIFIPKSAKDRVLKSGKKKRVEKTSFPGYMLVEMVMDDQTNLIVRETPKVTGFVGNQHHPKAISDQEVMRLTAPEAFQEKAQEAAATLSFEKGESVKVIDGAFTNFDGVVEAVQADKMKLRILVSIFGRATPVELDYHQVQKLT